MSKSRIRPVVTAIVTAGVLAFGVAAAPATPAPAAGQPAASAALSSAALSSTVDGSRATAASDLDRVRQILTGTDPATWVFTGDSITHGAMHTLGWRSYSQHFEERVRWELDKRSDFVVNTGISGDRTGDILADFDGRVTRFQPAVVSIMIGMNDVTGGEAGRTVFGDNLRVLVDKVRATGAIPVLNTPNTLNREVPERADLPAYAQVVREVAGERGTVLIDHYALWTQAATPAWFSDAIHPNNAGHHELAKKIFHDLGIYDPASPTCGLTL